MTGTKFLKAAETFEVQEYRRPKNVKNLLKTHVAFSGSPSKHPTDERKVILIGDPFSAHAFYYEFKTEDIAYAEELSSLVTVDGDAIPMVRIWVKKGSIGMRILPFVVQDLGMTP